VLRLTAEKICKLELVNSRWCDVKLLLTWYGENPLPFPEHLGIQLSAQRPAT